MCLVTHLRVNEAQESAIDPGETMYLVIIYRKLMGASRVSRGKMTFSNIGIESLWVSPGTHLSANDGAEDLTPPGIDVLNSTQHLIR